MAWVQFRLLLLSYFGQKDGLKELAMLIFVKDPFVVIPINKIVVDTQAKIKTFQSL